MQLYKQVCTLAQSARLVELGVNIEPFLWWVQERAYPDNCNVLTAEHKPKGIDIDAFIILPAYTVAELGEMLPMFTYSWRGRKGDFGCISSYEQPDDEGIDYFIDTDDFFIGEHEAEARAAMLIPLLEQGVLKPEQINQNK